MQKHSRRQQNSRRAIHAGEKDEHAFLFPSGCVDLGPATGILTSPVQPPPPVHLPESPPGSPKWSLFRPFSVLEREDAFYGWERAMILSEVGMVASLSIELTYLLVLLPVPPNHQSLPLPLPTPHLLLSLHRPLRP
jgi:hypothetical protein